MKIFNSLFITIVMFYDIYLLITKVSCNDMIGYFISKESDSTKSLNMKALKKTIEQMNNNKITEYLVLNSASILRPFAASIYSQIGTFIMLALLMLAIVSFFTHSWILLVGNLLFVIVTELIRSKYNSISRIQEFAHSNAKRDIKSESIFENLDNKMKLKILELNEKNYLELIKEFHYKYGINLDSEYKNA
jgi:hypothetical protein